MGSGNARSHRDGGGLPVFLRKTGFSEYLLCKYSDSPRPSGTPLINAGGKRTAFSCGFGDTMIESKMLIDLNQQVGKHMISQVCHSERSVSGVEESSH